MRTKTQEAFLIAQIRKMASEGLSATKIAEELKLSYQLANQLRKKGNIKLQKPANKLIDRIRELAEKKMSVRKISKEINRSVRTTFEYMVRYNIPRAYKSKRKFEDGIGDEK